MSRRILPIVGAAASVIAVGALLVFLLVPPPASADPVGPTDREVAEYRASVLAQTWAGTGLPGEAPVIEPDPTGNPLEQFDDLDACMRGAGFTLNGYSSGGGSGFQLSGYEGDAVFPADEQYAWYVCVASNVTDPVASGELLTASQRAFLFDFQSGWVAPCLTLSGYRIDLPVTRSEALTVPGFERWTAFGQVFMNPPDEAVVDAMIARCGPETAVLP